MELTASKIEIALANFFDFRRNIIVPNVSWGLLTHECDLLVITKSGYASEVEIKVSKSDLKRDLLKSHGHYSNLIKRLFFAIPEGLVKFQEFIPERAGIIQVIRGNLGYGYGCKILKRAKINKYAKPLSTNEIIQLGRLASIRMWCLKKTLSNENNKDSNIEYYI